MPLSGLSTRSGSRTSPRLGYSTATGRLGSRKGLARKGITKLQLFPEASMDYWLRSQDMLGMTTWLSGTARSLDKRGTALRQGSPAAVRIPTARAIRTIVETALRDASAVQGAGWTADQQVYNLRDVYGNNRLSGGTRRKLFGCHRPILCDRTAISSRLPRGRDRQSGREAGTVATAERPGVCSARDHSAPHRGLAPTVIILAGEILIPGARLRARRLIPWCGP